MARVNDALPSAAAPRASAFMSDRLRLTLYAWLPIIGLILAWEAFAQEYGLVQVSIDREAKDPDARELAQVIASARAAGVRVVFVQPQFDPTPARLVAAEIGARIETLDALAPDWDQNLRRSARAIAAAAVP